MENFRHNKLAIVFYLLGLIAIAFFASCKKADDTESRLVEMSLQLTNTSEQEDFEEVNVDIRSVQVFYENKTAGSDGAATLEIRPGIYDLLSLKKNVSVVLAERKEVPAGKISEIRIDIGPSSSVKLKSGTVKNLDMADGLKPVLVIKTGAELAPGRNLRLMLDFDTRESVKITNEGEDFKLSPVIRVQSLTYDYNRS